MWVSMKIVPYKKLTGPNTRMRLPNRIQFVLKIKLDFETKILFVS